MKDVTPPRWKYPTFLEVPEMPTRQRQSKSRRIRRRHQCIRLSQADRGAAERRLLTVRYLRNFGEMAERLSEDARGKFDRMLEGSMTARCKCCGQPTKVRSTAEHNHAFALVAAAFAHWPEAHEFQPEALSIYDTGLRAKPVTSTSRRSTPNSATSSQQWCEADSNSN